MARLRARLRRWFRPPRKFRLTRDGKWFIGATLLLGFAAVNGGINLLFLMFGMMLSLLVANGLMAEACMHAALLNVTINLTSIMDKEYVTQTQARIEALTAGKSDTKARVLAIVHEKIGA